MPENRAQPLTNAIRDDKINLTYMNYDFHLKHTTQDTIVYSYTLSTKLNPALEDRSQM